MEQIIMPVIDEDMERRRVTRILLRLQRYVRGYLPDVRIETDEDFSKNPAEVKIRVWWKTEGGQSPIEDQLDRHEYSSETPS